MKNRKWIQILVLAGIVIVGAITIGSSLTGSKTSVKTGDEAPDFTLKDLDGKQWTLSELRGRPVIVNFWGTFCPPCVREMPALQRQYDKWQEEGLVVLGLNLNESPVTVKAFVRRYQINFPILLDKDTARRSYNVRSYPTTYYIDASGTIQDVFVGEMTEDHIEQRVRQLLRASSQ